MKASHINLILLALVALVLLTLSVIVIAPVHAAIPNPPAMNNHPVIDAANIIPDDEEAALTAKLFNVKARSKHEVAVLTVSDMGGYDIEEYSINAARFYGLGGKDADDGVLITVCTCHHARIEVGRGLTGMLTDLQSGAIMDDVMIPEFKRGDYVAGINAGVDRIAGIIVPLTPAQLLVRQRAEQERNLRHARQWASFKDAMGNVFLLLIIGGILFTAIAIATAPARKRRREEREEEERKEAAQRQADILAELEREAEERRKAERARQRRVAAEKRKFDSWYGGLSPHEKRAYDAEQARKVREAEAARVAADEAAAERRRRDAESSSSYSGGSYDYGSSSSSSSSSDYGSSSSSSSDFGGGGGSFDGGGSSGSW